MRNAIVTLMLMTTLAGAPAANDFWVHFADNLTFNASVRSGDIPARLDAHEFSAKETRNLLSRAFGASLPLRLGEVAKESRFVAIPCAFSRTPEKCFAKVVLDRTFDEVGLIRAPGVSGKFAKRLSNMYLRKIRIKGAPHETAARALTINRWKPLSPRIGFNAKDFDIVATNPFYTYYGIYVEPKFGVKNGGVVTLYKKNLAFEVSSDGAALSYRIGKKPHSKKFYSVTWRPNGELRVDNVLVVW